MYRRVLYLSVFYIIYGAINSGFPAGICNIAKPYICKNDSIPNIWLPETVIKDKRIFKTKKQREKYNRLKRDVLKTLPYAKYASIRYRKLEYDLMMTDGEKERKTLIKQCEKEIKNKFEKDLRNMTVRQGVILIKLIDRETGRTSYNLVKELKSSIHALLWQTVARIFGHNLKDKYDPTEDKDIEQIIQAAGDPDFEDSRLLYYNYIKQFKWK